MQNRIKPESLVATEARKLNGRTISVCYDALLESMTLTNEVADDGWQLAQYPNTGCLVLVRATNDHKHVGNVAAVKVELAEVSTEVEYVADTFAIVAGVGETRPMGWTRAENIC